MDIGQRIKKRREELGISAEELGKAIGKVKTTIYRYESGYIDSMPSSILVPIAAALHTTPAYLMGWVEDGTDSGKFGLSPLPETYEIPIIGTIACGTPILAEENYEGTARVPNNIHADFALYCKGDSMIGARINDGDLVYIKMQSTVNNGEIAAVLIDDEATLKRVYINLNNITLLPCNEKYAPMIYTGAQCENIIIIGKAVAFTSMLKM